MKIKIDQLGNLKIERPGTKGGFRAADCPFTADKYCGDHCPHFGEPEEEYATSGPSGWPKLTGNMMLELCYKKILRADKADFVDERGTEPVKARPEAEEKEEQPCLGCYHSLDDEPDELNRVHCEKCVRANGEVGAEDHYEEPPKKIPPPPPPPPAEKVLGEGEAPKALKTSTALSICEECRWAKDDGSPDPEVWPCDHCSVFKDTEKEGCFEKPVPACKDCINEFKRGPLDGFSGCISCVNGKEGGKLNNYKKNPSVD